MAGKPLAMSKADEIKRLLSLGLSHRAISRALGVHRDTVRHYLNAPEQERVSEPSPGWTQTIEWKRLEGELQHGVSLYVLWEELRENHQINVGYPAFWKQLRKRLPNVGKSMVRIFAPGSRVEIDYCDGITIHNPATGEQQKTELFVGVLCHSR